MFKSIFRITERYWKNRNIDWNKCYWIDHPHREELISVLRGIDFRTVLEIGCGASKNLDKIKKEFPKSIIGGIDINKDAIKFSKNKFFEYKDFFLEGTAENIYWYNKTWDLILTDACLIYVPPWKIRRVRNELLRVAKKAIVMVEWHSNIGGLRKFHWVRNYKRLFKGHKVYLTKIEKWKKGGWEKFGYIIYVKI